MILHFEILSFLWVSTLSELCQFLHVLLLKALLFACMLLTTNAYMAFLLIKGDRNPNDDCVLS